MELQAARQIIDTLAQGIHPVTGELMPDDSPYNAPPVIRALFAVSQALEGRRGGVPGDGPAPDADVAAATAARARKPAPANAGKPWAPDDDAKLEAAFAAGIDLKDVAQEFGRSAFALESRLVKLGKLPPRPGMRFAPA